MLRLSLSHTAPVVSATTLLAAVLVGCPAETLTGDTAQDAGAPSSVSDAADAPQGPREADGSDASSAARPTHTGLVSVQDISIANLPAAGHGLTVNVFFQAARPPAFEETPGDVTGCRAWTYDVATAPPPADEDHGAIALAGVRGGPLTCRFAPGRGYVCPTAAGSAVIALEAASGGAARVSVVGASFTAADVGRYLAVTGATGAPNNGAFAIVAAPSSTELVIGNPRATAETFTSTYTVLAGAGPVPNDVYEPFDGNTPVHVGLTPGGGHAFDAMDVALAPGAAFELDGPSRAKLVEVPVTGESLTLACEACGKADGTIVRLSTTDGDVAGLSPVAMPAPKRKSVEIQCVALGTGTVTVPAAAMALVRAANDASPITRVRTAFMRDGLAVRSNEAVRAPNRIALAVGRGVLGFTTR